MSNTVGIGGPRVSKAVLTVELDDGQVLEYSVKQTKHARSNIEVQIAAEVSTCNIAGDSGWVERVTEGPPDVDFHVYGKSVKQKRRRIRESAV